MSAVENTIPVLPVSDITRSLQYFTQTLGWTEVWRSDNLGTVSRDGHQIMLSQLLPVNGGTTAWIGLRDDSLMETYRHQAGITVVQDPINWNWGYDMKIADPDGNLLWLATGPRDDLPRRM